MYNNNYYECPGCHNKIEINSRCSNCLMIIDPNDPRQSISNENVLCEFCKKNIPINEFDEHDNNCVIKKSVFEIQEQEQEQQLRRQNIINNQNRVIHDQANNRNNNILQQRQQQQNINIQQNPNERLFFNIRQQQQQQSQSQRLYSNNNNLNQLFSHLFGGLNIQRQTQRPIQQQHRNRQFNQIDPFGYLVELLEQNQDIDRNVNVENLIKIKYKESIQLSEENKKCLICLSEYSENEELVLLECTHRFHTECIIDWLKKSNKCPVCRHDVNA